MNSDFKYITDPIFLFSLSLYILNKFSILPFNFCEYKFSICYLNDILLVPASIPLILFLLKMFKFRTDNSPPMLIEIIIPLVIWSIIFEFIGPFLFGKGTPDFLDVLAYSIGGIISWLMWNMPIFINSYLENSSIIEGFLFRKDFNYGKDVIDSIFNFNSLYLQ